jgi:hypothetical protein
MPHLEVVANKRQGEGDVYMKSSFPIRLAREKVSPRAFMSGFSEDLPTRRSMSELSLRTPFQVVGGGGAK